MKWIQALKEWNSQTNTGKWCIPRKGSSDYDVVKKIMSSSSQPSSQPDQGYIKYAKQEKPRLKKDNPKLTNTQLADIVSKMWKTLTPTEKKSYT